MGIFTKLAQQIFAPVDENGSPRAISEQEVGVWGTEVEALVNAFVSTGGLIYASKTALDADLAKPANTMAWVMGDPVAANNGIYGKVGASGGGSWSRRGDLPFSFIIASNAGAGTPNAIQATTRVPVSNSALIWMNIAETNGPGPTTVQYNGSGPIYTLKTNSGNDPVEGGLPAGMIVLGIVSGSSFRLVSDQASAALLAAMEAALADFNRRYLPAAAIDYTTDLEGRPLIEGALYFNSSTGKFRVFHSGSWQDQAVAVSDGDVTVPKLAADVKTVLAVSTSWFPSIQDALDAVGLKGGGEVILSDAVTRDFETAVQLGVPSNVWFRGDGMGVTKLTAAASLAKDQNVITNKKNNGLSRTDYDVGIRISDMFVDGNDGNRSAGERLGGKGTNLCLSTVKDCIIERIETTGGSTHNIDVMASVYLNDGNSNNQPAGPSLNVTIADVVSHNPGYDDCITVHNSGKVSVSRARVYGPAPYEWSYGVEFDEGSWGCVAEDVHASGGFVRAFASKGHPTTHGAQFNHFLRCVSDGNAQGFWLYHSPTGGGPNNWGVSIRDCEIQNPIESEHITGWENLMEIAYTPHVEVTNLTLVNPGKGIIKLNTGANDIKFDGVHIYGVAALDGAWTDKLGIFTIYGGVAPRANITISNVKAYDAQPRPIIRLYDGDGTYEFRKIDADGTDNTIGIVHVPTALSTTLAIGGVIGSGWAGLVYDTAQSRAYNDFYRQEFGEMKYVSIGSGSPEGVTYAPAGAICVAYRSGNSFKKNTAGNLNTGWTAF